MRLVQSENGISIELTAAEAGLIVHALDDIPEYVAKNHPKLKVLYDELSILAEARKWVSSSR